MVLKSRTDKGCLYTGIVLASVTLDGLESRMSCVSIVVQFEGFSFKIIRNIRVLVMLVFTHAATFTVKGPS